MACSDPEPFEDKPFLGRIESVVDVSRDSDIDSEMALANLSQLADQMLATCREEVADFSERSGLDPDDSGNARARFMIDNAVSTNKLVESDLARAFSAFHDISVFCELFDLRWHVIG